jgi:hypothetical protein
MLDSKMGDGGGFLFEEMLDALESHAQATEADCHISLYAISSAPDSKAIHLRALIGKQFLSIMVDSGNSTNFINVAMLDKIPHMAVPAPPLKVKVANGQCIFSIETVHGLELWIQGHTFCTDAGVLNMGAYDMILGMD